MNAVSPQCQTQRPARLAEAPAQEPVPGHRVDQPQRERRVALFHGGVQRDAHIGGFAVEHFVYDSLKAGADALKVAEVALDAVGGVGRGVSAARRRVRAGLPAPLAPRRPPPGAALVLAEWAACAERAATLGVRAK